MRKLVKAGVTAEKNATKRMSGKPVSKVANKVEKKADKVMSNPAQLEGGKASKKAAAVTKGIVKQYNKNVKTGKK
jgi:hypothetical protein